jgi:hypothetical protein
VERPADSQPRRQQPGGVLRGVEVVAVLDVVHRALHPHGEPAVRRAEVARRLVVLADEQVDVAVDRSLAAQFVGQVAGGVEVADPQQAAVQVAADVGRHVLPGLDSAAEADHRFAEVTRRGQVLACADEQQGPGDVPGPRVGLLGPGGEPLRRGAALLRRPGSRVQLLDVVRGPWSAHPATVGGARGSRHRAAERGGAGWRAASRQRPAPSPLSVPHRSVAPIGVEAKPPDAQRRGGYCALTDGLGRMGGRAAIGVICKPPRVL